MGLEIKFENNENKIIAEFRGAADAALKAIGNQAVSYAKQNLNSDPQRIDTGLLLNSITYAMAGDEPAIQSYMANKPKKGESKVRTGSYSGQAEADGTGEQSVWIGTNVEYAGYVHDGTEKMIPNRFIKNAIVKHRDEYKAIMEKIMKK